jgi:hypothetical protein
MNFLYPNIGALHRGPKAQNGDFPEDGSNYFNYTGVILGEHFCT